MKLRSGWVVLFCLVGWCLSALSTAVATSYPSPDGYWLLYDKDHKTKRLITQVSVEPGDVDKQTQQLHFTLVTVWPNKKLKHNVFVCTQCQGGWRNKPMDTISPLWGNVYSPKTHRWEKGSLLQSHLGRILTTSVQFDEDYKNASMRVYKFSSALGVTLYWVRLTPAQVMALKKETQAQWAQQWLEHPDYYNNQKALYLRYASSTQPSNTELMQQIYSH